MESMSLRNDPQVSKAPTTLCPIDTLSGCHLLHYDHIAPAEGPAEPARSLPEDWDFAIASSL